MRTFARLFRTLEETAEADGKLAALLAYVRAVPPSDAAWAVYLLSGRRPRRLVSPACLRAWAMEAAGIGEWLFEESRRAAGDLAETITLLVSDPAEPAERPLAWWMEQRLLRLSGEDEAIRHSEMLASWSELGRDERFVWNKLVLGAFRPPVAVRILVRALAEVSGLAPGTIDHRLAEPWEPSPEWMERLLAPATRDVEVSRPYPFQPAAALAGAPASAVLGPAGAWIAEWLWVGRRAQLVRRAGRTFLWSREPELLTSRFPEIEAAAAFLPDGSVVDGELVTTQGKPAALLAYDLLEELGRDLRDRPLSERRDRLAALIAGTPAAADRLVLSPVLEAADWDAVAALRARARAEGAGGVILKRRAGRYGGAPDDWLAWRLEPLSVDAVLMYARPGAGGPSGLDAEYTFGVWDGDALVPLARTGSGLSESEGRRLDSFVRRNTLEKFGPVRTVRPALVFELAFDRVVRSARHKAGVAVRGPRIVGWRTDRQPEQADTLERVRALIGQPE
ncbi:MAG TPA: ATP-dependent DNA ligase [Gemmatimonadales bacterium]